MSIATVSSAIKVIAWWGKTCHQSPADARCGRGGYLHFHRGAYCEIRRNKSVKDMQTNKTANRTSCLEPLKSQT